MLQVQHRLFLHVDDIARLGLAVGIGLFQRHVVADLALEADIRDQPLVGFRIETRQVAGVRVAVRVAVGDIEQIDELVTVGDGAHSCAPCSVDSVVSALSSFL
ncbi:hypothetical protein D3C84_1146410 [compost metagenome]